MNLGFSHQSLLLSASSIFFGLWPVFLVLILVDRKRKLPITLLLFWLAGFAARVHLAWNRETAYLRLFPEPWYTIAFAVIGLLVIGFLSLRAYRKISKIRDVKSLEKLLELTPTEFEQVVARLYEKRGYKVTHVGQSGDHGVDLMVEDTNGDKVVVQCKRWKGRVGEPLIRDLYGAMYHESAHRATLVTTGTFTNQAREWAAGKPISLYNGERLVELLKTIN